MFHTFASSLLFGSGASLIDFGSELGAVAGEAPEDAGTGAELLVAAADAAAAASVVAASVAVAGAPFFPSSGLFVSFLSSFLSEAPFGFPPSAKVGKIALIVVVLRGTLFFFSFRNQLLNPPTYIRDIYAIK